MLQMKRGAMRQRLSRTERYAQIDNVGSTTDKEGKRKDVMKQYMDNDVTSRGRDVTNENDERTENNADNEEVGDAVISVFTNEENEAESSKTKSKAKRMTTTKITSGCRRYCGSRSKR